MEAENKTSYTLFSGPDPLEALLNFDVNKNNCQNENNSQGDATSVVIAKKKRNNQSDSDSCRHVSNIDNLQMFKEITACSQIDLKYVSRSPESVRIEQDKFRIGIHPYHYTGPYIKQEKDKSLKKKIFQCPIKECNQKFRLKPFLQSHLITHSVSNFVCKFCHKVFKDINLLKKHEILHYDKDGKLKSFECPAPGCNQVCLSYRSLCKHETSQHNQDTHVYKCDHCNKTFLSLSLYYRHNNFHVLPLVHSCLECGKCFKSLGELNCHRNLHKNNDYMCELCGLEFKKIGNLNRHKKIHTSKNHFCTICFANFNYSISLTRHMMKTHPNALKKIKKNKSAQ